MKTNSLQTFTAAIIILLMGLSAQSQPWKDHGKLVVESMNPHYLQYQDGTSFFWFADTGWEMLHRLNRDEITKYLENRKLKGFNVIQTVIISEFIHMDKVTNFYGDSIFVNENPEKPLITPGSNPDNGREYDFWDHVDYAVQTAEKNGLYLALVPSWGEWVTPRSDKALFNTVEQAYNYGCFLGNRYKTYPNIIWMLGGDRHPNERNIGIDLWRAMAEGITDGTTGERNLNGKADYPATLITHHSYNSSSNWFHNDGWIDFHTWGSYHAEIDNPRSIELALADWNLKNPKPTLNSEPCYEGGGINYAIDDNGYFTSTDVRIAAYWSVFSGGAGITYGCQPIWQFTDQSRKKHSPKTIMDWKEGLDLPGAVQLGYLKKLITSRDMKNLRPDRSMLISGMGSCSSYAPVLKGKSHAFIYIPTGNSIKVKLGEISGTKIKASWFNPRTGTFTFIGEFVNSGDKDFKVPGMSADLTWLRSGRGCDWVLVLDDASVQFSVQ